MLQREEEEEETGLVSVCLSIKAQVNISYNDDFYSHVCCHNTFRSVTEFVL